MKKIYAILICLFSLTMTYTITVSTAPTSGNTIYVDDDNTEGPWDGTNEHPYKIIQDAVDATNDGDTVFVNSGIYTDFFPENLACVKIDKIINLVGEDKNTTIINGPGYQRVIILGHYNRGVDISGFTIKNGDEPTPSGWNLGIQLNSGIAIHGNIIKNANGGIFVNQQFKNILIYDNIIMQNNKGIEAEFNAKSNIMICNNIIKENNVGIYLCVNSDVSVYKNIISNNKAGIDCKDLSSCTISHNHIIENNVGIITINCKKMMINTNNFIANDRHAEIKRDVLLSKIRTHRDYKQEWNGNYWDDVTILFKKPIRGFTNVYIIILRIHPKLTTSIPITRFPIVEYDKNPAKEPYKIG